MGEERSVNPGRPAVPSALKRELYEEAGYRCAIPTCRGTSALEMAHIRPWSEVREHTYENMIVLCAVDHTRFDRGEIPRQSVKAFKDNLMLMKSRYTESERRILVTFAQGQEADLASGYLVIPGGTSYTVSALIRDGLIVVEPNDQMSIGGLPPYETVELTQKGIDAVRRLRRAQRLDPTLS